MQRTPLSILAFDQNEKFITIQYNTNTIQHKKHLKHQLQKNRPPVPYKTVSLYI